MKDEANETSKTKLYIEPCTPPCWEKVAGFNMMKKKKKTNYCRLMRAYPRNIPSLEYPGRILKIFSY